LVSILVNWRIPYDPHPYLIAATGVFGIGSIVARAFGWDSGWLHFGASLICLTLFVPLCVRRFWWKQWLVLTDETLTVPTGLLKTRPTVVYLASVQRMWIVSLHGSVILRLRTPERTVDIPHSLLPDSSTFRELINQLRSRVPAGAFHEQA
jgi:hypothetical protein